MNRNNFLPHIALALVLILVAAFAGQLRRWQKQWKAQVMIIPAEKKRPTTTDEITLTDNQHLGRPEILVRFKPGISDETINRITSQLNDRVEDRI